MLSVFDNGPPPPCPARFNLAAHVLGRAAELADKTALSVLGPDSAETFSYAELSRAVRGTATGLLEAGLKPGDKVLIRLGNTPDFPIAYLAALTVDLVPVPTSAALTEPEVQYIVDSLEPAASLHDPDVSCPEMDRRIGVDDLRAMRARPPAEFAMGDPNRLAYVIYTSGTSGQPRAVAHAHRAIWARQMMIDGWYGLRAGDRLLHAGAFNWTYTLGTGLMDPWTVGATALIPGRGTPATDLPRLLARHDATIFAAAPGVYRQALRGAVPPLPRLRHGLSAGEKLPDTTRAGWEAATGTPIFEAYGMSECSTFISASPDKPAAPGTLGCPQPGRRVAILGDDGPVPLGQPGTIAVRRDDPGLMLGYLGAPEATAARMRGEWFLTGDLGSMDENGHITYLGRADDMMNAGGYRVSPLEVENALAHCPDLSGIGVTEVPVGPGKSIIAAFYTAPAPVETALLDSYAQERLARYKQPRAWVHLDALPTGANGKLLRRALRDLWKDRTP